MLKPTNTNYLFKFSIVTAVYNVAPYLSEAIDSILSQDIGFLESVELILVDDGSTDASGAICDEYQHKYPENIVVIHKPNGALPAHEMQVSLWPVEDTLISWILTIN